MEPTQPKTIDQTWDGLEPSQNKGWNQPNPLGPVTKHTVTDSTRCTCPNPCQAFELKDHAAVRRGKNIYEAVEPWNPASSSWEAAPVGGPAPRQRQFQGRPAKNMGPVPNFNLDPDYNSNNIIKVHFIATSIK